MSLADVLVLAEVLEVGDFFFGKADHIDTPLWFWVVDGDELGDCGWLGEAEVVPPVWFEAGWRVSAVGS